MDRTNKCDLTSIAILLISCAILGWIVAGYISEKPRAKVEQEEIVQTQKYRFDVECPDKSRVGYVATKRLPKSTVCQPDPQ